MIKDNLIQRIERKGWRAGDRVPSVNELAAEFDVSRMTARRALQELSDEGILVRISDPGGPNEQRTVLARHVAKLLEG